MGVQCIACCPANYWRQTELRLFRAGNAVFHVKQSRCTQTQLSQGQNACALAVITRLPVPSPPQNTGAALDSSACACLTEDVQVSARQRGTADTQCAVNARGARVQIKVSRPCQARGQNSYCTCRPRAAFRQLSGRRGRRPALLCLYGRECIPSFTVRS